MQPSLTTSNNGGGQTTTQDPQTAGQGNLSPAPTGSLQSNQDALDLNSDTGISLQPTPLSGVPIGSASTATSIPGTGKPAYHVNGSLLGVAILLFIVAVVLFIQTFRSANNTTD
ncbi:MAG TPA: hypothetical protein VFN51_01515 [Candidatus Saccharimonadales bacterium]|nr:hypothetical protein [Candidatus Saccharimonadales bacterium]